MFGSAAALTALSFLVAVAVLLTARPEPPQASASTDLDAHDATQSAHTSTAVAGQHR